ncbi:MAG: hypothetical protein MUQ30_13900, partial [Anaerolineae bacterium]|nr:hypothetical protein [Anaerolineae bacterium]
MKIEDITLSVFELPSNTARFTLAEESHGAQRRWVRRHHSRRTDELHILHVRTDEGIEGVCTAGDARYTTMRLQDLEQLRILALGENPLEDRERLNSKLSAATRGLFGLVHAHLVCAVGNTSYYEHVPGGSRDEAGKAIGPLTPPHPNQRSHRSAQHAGLGR